MILDKPTPDITPIIAKIMGNLLVNRDVSKNGNDLKVNISIKNYSTLALKFKLHDAHAFPIRDADPEPKLISLGRDTDHIWQIDIKSKDKQSIVYNLPFISIDEVTDMPELIIEGLEDEVVNGAKAIRGYPDE